jgi:hypothetical protein
MYSYNHISLIGRVGSVSEGTSKNGHFYVKFSVATKRPSFKTESQEPVTDWHHIIVWRDRAVVCKDRLKVGEFVSINGELRHSKDATGKYWDEIYIPDHEKIGFLGRPEKQEFPKPLFGGDSIPMLDEKKMPVFNTTIDGKKPFASSVTDTALSTPKVQSKIFEEDLPF